MAPRLVWPWGKRYIFLECLSAERIEYMLCMWCHECVRAWVPYEDVVACLLIAEIMPESNSLAQHCLQDTEQCKDKKMVLDAIIFHVTCPRASEETGVQTIITIGSSRVVCGSYYVVQVTRMKQLSLYLVLVWSAMLHTQQVCTWNEEQAGDFDRLLNAILQDLYNLLYWI